MVIEVVVVVVVVVVVAAVVVADVPTGERWMNETSLQVGRFRPTPSYYWPSSWHGWSVKAP